MVDTFRSRLADELAEAGEPPLGDLVDAAIARGQRLVLRRRVRLAAAALSVTVVLGLTGAGLVLTDRGDPGGGTLPAAEASTGERVEATPEGLLELLLRLLPGGTTGEYAGLRDRRAGIVSVQTYLVRDGGSGLVRLTVGRGGLFGPAPGMPPSTLRPTRDVPPCVTTNGIPCAQADQGEVAWSDGRTYQVATNAADCGRSARIAVLHPDEVRVTIEIDTCPARSRGGDPSTVDAPGAGAVTGLPLTPAEAIELGGDRRWGLRIDPGLAEAGARRFPHLPEPGRR